MEQDVNLDEILGWLVYGIFKVALYLALIFVFFSQFYDVWTSIFEHGEGWNDTDLVEKLIIFSFVPVVLRFFKKCKQYNFTIWESIKRFIFFIALHNLLWAFLIIFLAAYAPEVLSEYLDDIDFVSNLTFMLVIFALAPMGGFWQESDESSPLDEAVAGR